MDDNPQFDAQTITGAPGLVTLGGKAYLVGQPTPGDLGAIIGELKKVAKNPVQALRDDPDFALIPEDEQKTMLAEAARKKLNSAMPLDPMSALEAMTSLPMVRFLAWVLIRKHEPAFTLEQATSLITEENRLQVSVELDAESCMGRLGNSAGQSGS